MEAQKWQLMMMQEMVWELPWWTAHPQNRR
jgi:hypothetical protein